MGSVLVVVIVGVVITAIAGATMLGQQPATQADGTGSAGPLGAALRRRAVR